jgi:8-amino-3,8-dideoxy-alpha-D-manno-octulosonate transaminase
LHKLKEQDFSASDKIMSRCISTLISLTWTEEQVKKKGEKILRVAQKVLSSSGVSV